VTRPELDGPAWGLLAVAVGYALRAAGPVTPELMSCTTPCRGWDLRMLLRHAAESLAALREGVCAGQVGLHADPESAEVLDDPAAEFRTRAVALLGACTSAAGHYPLISVAGRCLPLGLAAGVGALEIAVHGWDISRACGQREPVPGPLATRLLEISPLLVPRDGRHPLFAAPVPVGPGACLSDRLAAWLGRDPAT
jgi:uncharacterized protein (TIGR03086 family)